MLGRIYLILRHRVAPSPFWDGLPFGGVAFFIAYLYLGMFRTYYLAPVDLIAVLYIGRFLVLSWKKTPSWDKNVIHGQAEIASVVKTQYRSGAGNDLRLFFPCSPLYDHGICCLPRLSRYPCGRIDWGSRRHEQRSFGDKGCC
jgi:hypothetical protein